MRQPTPRRSAVRRGVARGFTLVELVTAASLMTVMMLGVIQIFRIITVTAGDAEAVHFTHEQVRCLFDRLHTDIRGLQRDGYMRILGNAYSWDPSASPPTFYTGAASATASPPREYNPFVASGNGAGPIKSFEYAMNTLEFTSVGYRESLWARSGGSGTYKADSAEVVYSSDVLSPDKLLQAISGTSSPRTAPVDPRRGILARCEWLICGTAGTPADNTDLSAAAYVCDIPNSITLPVPYTTFPIASLIDRARMVSTGTGGKPGTTANGNLAGYLKVWPWLAMADYNVTNAPSLRRVMASCVSEFFVEYYDPLFNKGDGGWVALSFPWTLTRTATGTPAYNLPAQCLHSPVLGLRVTVGLHDPSDRTSLGGRTRFDGYAMQETYWISDP